uniref:UTP14B small subunit processome component n=1 Tax=Jaculus jaculus TaxID=51337 RepID=A0A8C5NZ97_JACJA
MEPKMRQDPSLKSRAFRPRERKQAATMNVTRNVEGLLALSQQEQLVDMSNSYPLSASEDEEDSDGERKCQKLLEAISALGGKNRWKLAERSEASLKVSEFSVSSEGSGENLVLSDLLGAAKKLPLLTVVKKQLNRVRSKKTVETPLNKEEAERTLREVAFSRASHTLSKWDPVVVKNRQAEQLVFSMEQEPSAVAPLEHMFSGWKARTPLEQDVLNLLHKNRQPVTDPLLTPVEKASLKAMSLEEAKIHRAELQRARALQSYYEARARREKKIKSKKYHKIVKKGKAKKAQKECEHLWKANPNVALEEVGKIEKARMMERMSLKHQDGGKWAKSKAKMAKFDPEARQARQEQLAKNRVLTQKLQVPPESEEEQECLAEVATLFASEGMSDLSDNAPNPWMSRGDKVQTEPEQLPELGAHEFSKSEGDGRPVVVEDILEFPRKRSELNHNAKPVDRQTDKDSNSLKVLSESMKLSHQPRKHEMSSVGIVKEKREKQQMIDLQNLLSIKTPAVKSLAVPTIEELEGEVERDHKQLIKEAFAGDDVIRDFLKDKREAVEANEPNSDLTLPGWGEWVGAGLKSSTKKRRPLLKTPEGSQRKDKNLPNVIVSEKRNILMAGHQVQVLPLPFTHYQQFERTIQNPVGATWNTQRAFQKLTIPKVSTKPGHIIKPIKAENVGYRSSSRSDLSTLQSNPKGLSRRDYKQMRTCAAD